MIRVIYDNDEGIDDASNYSTIKQDISFINNDDNEYPPHLWDY